MTNQENQAIEIKEFLHLDTVKPVLASKIDFVTVTNCPCCRGELLPLSAVVEKNTKKSISIGICDHCGYVGYIDKPSERWVNTFYNETWDTSKKLTAETVKPFSPNIIISIIKELGIKNEEAIFDVGAGYGQMLKQCYDAGFRNLNGCEHSPHRAEVASEYANAEVVHTPFLSHHVDTLHKRGPYRLIYSKSVLEHVYDPDDFLRTANALQNEGDYLIISVPRVLKETFLNVLFFVPHLHSFSAQALSELAHRYGYEVVDVRPQGSGQILIARKKSGGDRLNEKHFDFSGRNATLSRYHNELEVAHLSNFPKLYWVNSRDVLMHSVLPKANSWLLAIFFIFLYKTFSHFPKIVSEVFKRGLLGIRRRHHAALFRMVEPPIDTPPLQIVVDKLFLHYK